MAANCKVLVFNKITGVATQGITGATFPPKAVILMSGCATATGAFEAMNSGGLGIGFIDAAGAFCNAESSADAATPAAERRTQAAKAFRIRDSGGTVTTECTATLDSDGLSLNWTTNDGVARVMYAICFGGEEITNVSAHEYTVTNTGVLHTEAKVIGFSPDIVFHMTCANGGALPQDTSNSGTILGVMSRAGDQWLAATTAFHLNNPTIARRSFLTDRFSEYDSGGSSIAFSSMDATGYTVNVGASFPSVRLIALAIKGGQWKVGTSAKPTGGAPASHVLTGLGYPIRGAIFVSSQLVATGSSQAHSEFTIGAASSPTERGSIVKLNREAVAVTIAKRYQDSTKVLIKVDNATPAVDAAAAVTSFDAASTVTLSWNPNDAVATLIGFVILGDGFVLPRPPVKIIDRRNTSRGRLVRGASLRRAA